MGPSRPFIFSLALGFEARDVFGFQGGHDAVEPAGLELYATWSCGGVSLVNGLKGELWRKGEAIPLLKAVGACGP